MTIMWLTLLTGLSTAACLHAQPAGRDADLETEIAAIRHVLREYRPAVLTIAQEYARAGHAPPPGTGRRRPMLRHQALADSLKGNVTDPRGDTLRVRASEPQVRGQTASVHVTVEGRLAGGHPGAFYETVALILEWVGGRWVIREHSQLGIS